jgi:hypothetical protein
MLQLYLVREGVHRSINYWYRSGFQCRKNFLSMDVSAMICNSLYPKFIY